MSCWPGDGNPNDVVGGNNGTPVGGTSYGPGHAGGQAFQFDGSTGYVDIGNPSGLKLTAGITLDAWINPTNVHGDLKAVISKWGGNNTTDSYAVYIVGDSWPCAGPAQVLGSIGVNGSNQCGVAGGSVPANQWTNVGMTYDAASGALTIYVNGSQASTAQVPGGINASDLNVQIGHQVAGGDRYFAGRIDHVSLYNRALSAAEMAQIGSTTAGGDTNPCGQSNVPALVVSSAQPVPALVAAQAAGSSTPDAAVATVATPAATPFSALQATIDWGDGTPGTAGAIRAATGSTSCEVVGKHTYARPGHYLITASVSDGTASRHAYGAASIYPALDPQPPPAVGVLVGDSAFSPPQCTATVINPDASTAETSAGRRLLNTIRAVADRRVQQLEHDVVVTAGHCIPRNGSGDAAQPWMFAPGFAGVSPLFFQDFATGKVASGSSKDFGGSPFSGAPIGTARLGVWTSTLPPIVVGGGSADDDWAFLIMNVPPPQAGHDTLDHQVGGGLPVHFEGDRAAWSSTSPRRWTVWGYDVSWTDGPTSFPGDLSTAEADAVAAQGGKLVDEGAPGKGCPNSPSSVYAICGINYPYLANANGLHRCDGTTAWPPGGVPPDAFTGPDVDALHITVSPCNLGNFASGGPYVTGGALWAINRGAFNGNLRPCCVNAGTFLSARALSVLAVYASIAPVVSQFGLLFNTFAVASGRTAGISVRHGTTVRYALSQASTVRIAIERQARGTRVGRHCRAVIPSSRTRDTCARFAAVGTLARVGHPGANRFFFNGHLGSRALTPGRYRAVLRARNAFNKAARPRTLSFRVVSR